MEECNELELAEGKFVALVFLLLFAVQAMLVSLLLFMALYAAAHQYDNSCPLVSWMGLIRSLPRHGDLISKGLDNAEYTGMYVFFAPSSTFYHVEPEPPKFPSADDELHVELMSLQTSEEWSSNNVIIFSDISSDISVRDALEPCSMALYTLAGSRDDVQAVVEMGVSYSAGNDMVASPLLVVEGHMQSLPAFVDGFSLVYDHFLCIPQLAKHYEAHELNTLQSIDDDDGLLDMQVGFEVMHVGDIDTFGGLDMV